MNDIVSVIIPTKNNASVLEAALKSLKNQTHKHIEIVIVDGKSSDQTVNIAKNYRCRVFTYVPDVPSGSFDASYKRNYGAKNAKGAYIYWMDADMVLPRTTISQAVKLCRSGAGAVILPEDSFGTGIWSRAKNLERRCYWGDDSVECPRFFPRSVWEAIGGFDLSLGAGGDDLDLHQKVLERGFTVRRTRAIVLHNEGALTLIKLWKKHFMYGRDTVRYFYKRPKASIKSYLLRFSYFRNFRLFARRPTDTFFFLIMRSTEYVAGFLGFLYSWVQPIRPKANPETDIEAYARSLPQYYGETIPEVLADYLEKGAFTTLLDCGCGDGALLFALKRRNYLKGKVAYGIDLSKNRIALVKKIDPSIHASVDDAVKLDTIRSNSIDFYISTFVIEHVDDKKMLKSMDRVLRKRATAYISTIFKKWYGWYYARKDGKWVMDVTHLREYTVDSELFDLIDMSKYEILESKKTLLYFPIIDFVVRRLFVKNRQVFLDNALLGLLRKITIPIPGYYGWEIILRKC